MAPDARRIRPDCDPVPGGLERSGLRDPLRGRDPGPDRTRGSVVRPAGVLALRVLRRALLVRAPCADRSDPEHRMEATDPILPPGDPRRGGLPGHRVNAMEAAERLGMLVGCRGR